MNEYERLRRQAEGLREIYPNGTRVECLSMMDPFAPVPSGTRGTVFHVDDMATNGKFCIMLSAIVTPPFSLCDKQIYFS